MSRRCAVKLTRLKEIVGYRQRWRTELDVVRRMQTRVLEAEHILSGEALRAASLPVSNTTVGAQFDAWCQGLRQHLADAPLTATEQRCVKHFLAVTDHLRSHLIQCYDQAGLPRTNNDMEGFIRAIKTRYRRLSGRKNWNRYLLHYGRRVAYYEAAARSAEAMERLTQRVPLIPASQWHAARAEQRLCQTDQLKRYRFRHKRTQFLEHLETRWAKASPGTTLLP